MSTAYITYSEYKALGGELDEDAFTIYERKSRKFLDTITFNRIQKLTIIPDEVKEYEVEIISRIYKYDNTKSSLPVTGEISSYSNGIESVTLSNNTEDSLKKSLIKLAFDWLPLYLTTRCANFDVESYLQQQSKYSEQTQS